MRSERWPGVEHRSAGALIILDESPDESLW